MSLWHPNDLLTDADLLSYERQILTQFGKVDWQTLRQKTLDDWLFPLLESRRFPVDKFRTRAAADKVWSYDGSAYTDQTSTARTSDGLVLSSLLSTSSKYLYLGGDVAFRGVSFRMLDSVNAASVTLATQVWADSWQSVEVENSTLSGVIPFARGGSVTWGPLEGVVRRAVNSSASLYWVRLSLSGAPTSGTAVGAVSLVRRSRLTAAVTFRTLMHIFREAPISQEGPWDAKALWYEKEAEKAWLRVADSIGPEFDIDGDDAIDGDENDQTAAQTTGGPWSLERA